jgi:hypothetical protein
MYSSLATLEFIHRAILLDTDSAPTRQCERNIIGTKFGEWIRPTNTSFDWIFWIINQINLFHVKSSSILSYLIKIKVKCRINI